MNTRSVLAPTTSASSTSTSGSASASRASISAWIALEILPPKRKKVGVRPLSNCTPARRTGYRKLRGQDSTGPVIRRPSERRYAGAMATAETDAAAAIETYLAALDGETRRVAPGEWGLTVDAAGWPLHVGVALRDGLLRAQAEVVEPGRIDDHVLLHWNRSLPLVRFSHTGAGAVWVQGDLPLRGRFGRPARRLPRAARARGDQAREAVGSG